MWDLKKGRNKFLNRHRFDSEHSFWWHVSRALAAAADDGQRDEIERDLAAYEAKHRENLHWQSTSSNCPAYAAVVEDIKEKLPQEWQALAKNIFVGIILDSEVNAEAWNHENAGVIEVSLQYLWALEAYASAFDEFAFALATRLNRRPEPHLIGGERGPTVENYGNLREAWTRLDTGVTGWRRPDAIEAGSADLVRIRPGRKQRDFDRYQEVAQEFIVCHEIAHHVLTHTAQSAHRREREARQLIVPLFEQLDTDSLAQLSNDSVREIEADLLAVAIVMGHFEGEITRGKAYRAVGGTILALVTATHVNEHWLVYDPNDTHPPLVLRLWFIFAAFTAWFADLPAGERGDHPLDYSLQWRVFVEALLTHWLGEQYPPIAEANALLNDEEYLDAIANRFLEGWRVLREPMPEFPEGM